MRRRTLRTVLGIGLSGSLLLAGCVSGLDRQSWPTEQPSAERPGASPMTPVAPTESGSTDTGAPAGQSDVIAAYALQPLPQYAGPKPLPAADGKPMLWPVSTQVSVYLGYQQIVQRSGFLDVSGKLVIPQRYESYQYCSDESGRPVLLIANRDGDARAEVFDLTGKRLATLPTARGDCAGSSYAITTNDDLDEASTQDDIKNGLFELATGKLVIPPIKGRQLTSLSPNLVNVTERKGEYFLNLTSGAKTPHPGWIPQSSSIEAGATAFPANAERDGGRVGFIDLSGHWLVTPRFEGAEAFSGSVAMVEHADGSYSLIDSKGRQLPGDWSQIDAVSRIVGSFTGWQTVGYTASGPAGQALYDSAGKPVVPQGMGNIGCIFEAEGACSLLLIDGHSQLITLPEGTVTDLPTGVDQALSHSFAGSSAHDGDGRGSVYSLVSGKTIETVGRSTCVGVGATYLDCGPDSEVLPHTVIDANGPTSFASVAALPEPGRAGDVRYYQVTTAQFIGIVDASGAWRYRQSRFTRLDD